MKRLFLLAVCLMLINAGLWAGVVVESSVTDLSNNESSVQKMWAQDGRLRLDVADVAEDDTSVLFLGDRMLFLNHDEKSYVEMDEATMEKLSSTIEQARRQMEEQLKNLPKAQREMMEKMLKERMGSMMGEALEPPVVERAGSGSGAGYNCTRYNVLRKGEKVVELCAADPSSLEGGEELVQAFHSMAAFMQRFLESIPQAADMAQGYLTALTDIEGFPVTSRRFENGQAVEETVLQSIESGSLSGDIFAVPSGYRKQKMMDN